MNNQNSTCCNAPVMVSSSDEGTACYVCRHCMKATDVVEQNSKCGCTHAKVKVIFQGSQCNECFDGFHEKCINNTSPRLENWEARLINNFIPYGPNGIMIDKGNIGAFKSFISTLLQEERERQKQKDMEIVNQSRTTNEEYGVGSRENTARFQAITDIDLQQL